MNQTQGTLSLDMQSFGVYSVPGEQPVAVLNASSSLHGRLLYCERVLGNLQTLASIGCGHENIDVQQLAALFSEQLEPMSNLLSSVKADCLQSAS